MFTRSIPRNQWRFLYLTIVLLLSIGLFPSRSSAQEPVNPEAEAAFDLTNNKVIDDADVTTAIEAWQSVRHAGTCINENVEHMDFTGTGCLDVADIQLVAANWGTVQDASMLEEDGEIRIAAATTTFTVDSDSDSGDEDPGDGRCETSSGECTLRAAIEEANVRPDSGTISIHFDIRENDGDCPDRVVIDSSKSFTIDSKKGGTIIDGYTQCGADENTEPVEGNADIRIEIRGNAQDEVHGIRIKSAHNVVRGLAVYNWDWQLNIVGPSAQYNRIEGNFWGTDAKNTRMADVERRTWRRYGVHIHQGASYNVLGCGRYSGTTFVPCEDEAEHFAARNIISGNGNDGIAITDQGTDHNRIVGNYIGLRQDGEHRPDTGFHKWGNLSDGFDIDSGPQHNWIGGMDHPGQRNVISGNYEGGELSHGSNTQFNHIVGNYIGVDAFGDGTDQSMNSLNGIALEDGVQDNVIAHNVISNNGFSGIYTKDESINRHTIEFNLIGVGPDGEEKMPNGVKNEPFSKHGIFLQTSSVGNIIRNNTIAHNPEHGILIKDSDSRNNTISQNRIYSNKAKGIEIVDGANNGHRQPSIQHANTNVVTGTSVRGDGSPCAGCTIEVFIAGEGADPGEVGQGRSFIGTGQTDTNGQFTVVVGESEVAVGDLVTATSTDAEGNTSMFSNNVVVEEGTDAPLPSPSPTPGDPAVTPSPVPTSTPLPEPSVTPTLEPGETATPSPTLEPGETPEPTETPEPGETPPPDDEATVTPEPEPGGSHRTWLPAVHRR